jgi:predicted branched-subunit amino acid permease
MSDRFIKARPSRRSAGFIKAFRDPPLAPATVLCFSFIGFGVLCHGAHIGLAPSLYTTLFIFALPAQVVLVDQIVRDVPLWTAALAVAFTGVRLLPMTVSLIPHLRAGRRLSWIDYLAAHFVAVTMWIESMRRIPFLPRGMRLPYYFGLAVILVGVSFIGTVAGYMVADYLPLTAAAALVFLTPAYFFLGLLGNCRRTPDYAPVVLGLCFEPLAAMIAPSFDLLLTGLVAGTASFFIVRRARETPKPPSAATIPGYRDAE